MLDTAIDLDDNGVAGTVLPNDEFSVPLHEPAHPITITAALDAPEDTRDLWRGYCPGFSPLDLESEFKAMNLSIESLPSAILQEELIREQSADPDCKKWLADARETKGRLFDIDPDGKLVRIAPLDQARQIVVPLALQPRLLHLEHFPVSAGHPGVSRMIRSLRRRFYWPNMALDVTNTVRNCTTSAKNRVKECSRSSFLKLFPATRPFSYVAIDILGPLPKTEHGNRFLLVMTNRFSKLTKTVPLHTTTAFFCARAFCEHWVYAYGVPLDVLTDNGPQFAAKFFQACIRELGVTKVFTTAYHPNTNGQVERFNRTILNSLRGYIAANQSNWDEFTSALTFAYNARVHASLGMAPFELVLSRPPVTLTVSVPGAEDPP
jgi:transposase InsO family protein